MNLKNEPTGKNKSTTWIMLLAIGSLMLIGLNGAKDISTAEKISVIIVAMLFNFGGIYLYFKSKKDKS